MKKEENCGNPIRVWKNRGEVCKNWRILMNNFEK